MLDDHKTPLFTGLESLLSYHCRSFKNSVWSLRLCHRCSVHQHRFLGSIFWYITTSCGDPPSSSSRRVLLLPVTWKFALRGQCLQLDFLFFCLCVFFSPSVFFTVEMIKAEGWLWSLLEWSSKVTPHSVSIFCPPSYAVGPRPRKCYVYEALPSLRPEDLQTPVQLRGSGDAMNDDWVAIEWPATSWLFWSCQICRWLSGICWCTVFWCMFNHFYVITCCSYWSFGFSKVLMCHVSRWFWLQSWMKMWVVSTCHFITKSLHMPLSCFGNV